MSNQAVIEIRGLEKRFGAFHLGPMDMTVPEGAIYGYVGPNGAGKTTTIDLIMGMGAKDAGSIRVFGMDHLKEEVAVKLKVGYVSPDLSYNAWGKVYKLIAFVRTFYPDWDDAYCEELLKRFQIGWHDRIATLSFGSRTKLALVVALSHRPALLLLDEPTSGLDAVAKRELFEELLDAVQDEQRTVLISSHNLDDVERFTDHLGILYKGRLMLEGSTSELVSRYRLIDCTLPDLFSPKAFESLRPQRRDGPRWRFLADTTNGALEQLKNAGATQITETPVTLEDLFVALVREDNA